MTKPPTKRKRLNSPSHSQDEEQLPQQLQDAEEQKQKYATPEMEDPTTQEPQEQLPTTPTASTLEEKADRRVSFAPQKENTSQSKMLDEDDDPKKKQPRLVMKKMVLNNFKSYAGRQVIGPFHKSFSAIVGPNGSGKSNVIDALLFVFGYRANKMRQGKLSELIHNSAKHPNCTQCSVEIHFQEIIDGNTPNEFTIVPNSQLVVSRQASKNNSSRYYINGKASNFTEVTTLLKARGIDLDHKRFLILQGEVESIALMKPKARDGNDDGLLEYLEDIIGTSKYKEPIEEASGRLEVFNEERAEKLNRVKYVSREMDAMEDKKAEAENYLENENELTRKKNELYQIYHFEARDNIQVATEAIKELHAKLEEEAQKYEGIEKEKAEIGNKYQELVDEYNRVEAETSTLLKRQTKLEKEEVQIRESKEHLQSKLEKGRATLESDRAARTAAQEAIKKNTEELKERKAELVDLENRLKEEEEKLETVSRELKGKTDGFMAQIEEHQRNLVPWNEKINEKRKTLEVKKSESEILADKIDAGERAVRDAEEQIDKLRSSLKNKEREIKELPDKSRELTIEIKELERYLVTLNKQETDLRTKLSHARQKADEARASMQHFQSRGKVLDSILRLRDSGRIEGIYDRLGSLGVIDDAYDIAISTACPALDNIVVETVEAAQACIEYLRKHNLGRAVFTVLNQLGRQRLDKIDTPEDVPRLFDLIQPKDEKFRAVFYSVLRDTLVAGDMRQANRIAYGKKRWRVVTMDGKLIERSGAMTGGGNRQLKGAMSSVFQNDGVSADVVAELERERDKLEREYRSISVEKRNSEAALNRKQDKVPKMDVVLEKLQMDLKSLGSQIEDEEERLEELRTQTEPSPADVAEQEKVQVEIEQLEQELVQLREQSAKIEATIAGLHEEIMNVGGTELRQQKACVNDVRKRIDTLNNRITKNMVAKSKAEKDVSKYEAAIAKFEKESTKSQEKLKELEESLNRFAVDIKDTVEEVEKAKEIMEEKKASMQEMKKELDAKAEAINKLRQSEVDTRNKLEDYKRTLIDNQKKMSHWEEQRNKLELQRIDEEPEDALVLPKFTDAELKELSESKQAIKMDIAEIETFVQNAKPNLSVLEEYRRRRQEYNERKADLDAVTSNRDKVKAEVENLRKKRLDEFMSGFNIISQKLKEMYQMITMGGNAELELVDSLDPFSEGIVFSVMPPKKSWKNISNLSGGEKTLSSLALVFALHHFKPTPLYVMDEIDAALDFRNVSIVANYIAERTKNAQFVIISLRNNMFELADRLVGIYKTSNCTKSIAINPNMIAMLTAVPTNANATKT